MSKTILVIDDERLITTTLRRLLKKAGYDVVTAHSYQEALDSVKETDFDLIISDIRLPETSGIEIIKDIRTYLGEQGKKRVPEILITGYADEDKYQAALDLKVAGYLSKPFDTADFLETVKKNAGSQE